MSTYRSPTGSTRAPDDPIAVLRREMAGLDTPPAVEEALLAAFARQHAPQAARLSWPRRFVAWLAAPSARAVRWAQGGAAVAVVALATVGVLRAGGGADAAHAAGGDAFIALESLERIAEEPAPRMVETKVPRIVLASLGVSVTAQNADDTVRAEMLVAADGHPLALRLTALN